MEDALDEWYAWLESVGALGDDPPRNRWTQEGEYVPLRDDT